MVSVIIPVFNGAETLGEQLAALANQDYEQDWEIIIVNNCSTDGTEALVKNWQQKIPHLRLVHAAERKGRAYARNVGASAAEGDLFLFCDADDVIAPGWVAALTRKLQEHHHVVGSVQSEKLNHSIYWKRPPPPAGDKKILDFLPFANTCNMGVSRKAFEEAQGFSETFIRGQDIDFSWRLQLLGYSLHAVPEAIVYYRYRDSFWGIWKQTCEYAAAHVLLYRHFAPHGMPRSSWKKAVKRNIWLVRKFAYLFDSSQEMKTRWMYTAGLSWGRLWGSVKYRRLYL